MTIQATKQNIIKMILIALNLIMAVFATFIFLVFLKVSPFIWLGVNICSPIQYLTIIALLTDRKVFMNATVPLLMYFGFGGLFRFSWSGYMLQAQINHLIMTITAIYVVFVTIKSGREGTRKLALGLGVGVLMLMVLMFYVYPQVYFNNPQFLQLLVEMGWE